MTFIVSIAVVVVATIAAISDLSTRRIPNFLTFGAAIAALVYHAVDGGVYGAGQASLGWIAGVALFLPFFALGGMGAGDVKLIAALSAWFGPFGALQLAAATAIAGGVVAVIVMLHARYFGRALRNLWLLIAHWWVNGIRTLPELTLASSRGPRLAYAVPILLGTLGVLWWQ
jgi:prepilin peptidase CpaA